MVPLDDLEDHIESVEYLARSPSRLQVLDLIHDGSQSRSELDEQVDVSRVTLGRVLSNFENRGWIRRMNGEYETTPEGEYIASELSKLLRNIGTLDHLDGAMDWLPIERFDFDLTCLRDAEVATADWSDHTAQIQRVADVIDGASRIAATASGVSRDVADSIWEATTTGNATVELIIDGTALSIIQTDPELARKHREMIANGDTEILHYDGADTPLLMVSVCDDTVILCGHDDDGPPPGTLESTHETVRNWAESYIDSVRGDSTQLTPDAFSD